MSEPAASKPQSPLRRAILVLVVAVTVFTLGAIGFMISVVSSFVPADAVLACTTDSYRVSRALSCWWAKGPADIDPNAPVFDDEMTVFMFTLNGYGLESGLDLADHNARVLDLLGHWSDDVDWSLTDQLGLTPLHAAVLHNDPDLVAALLEMGAPEDLTAGDAMDTFAGLTPAEMVEALHTHTRGSETMDTPEQNARRQAIADHLGATLPE